MILCFLDTETTGLDSEVSEILEIAVVRREPGGARREMHMRIKPTLEGLEKAHPKALEINGYAAAPELWEHAKAFPEVANKIADFLEGGILVGHNVGFDEQMLKSNLKRFEVKRRIPYRKIDTQALVMEHLFPLGLKRASLDSVRGFLGWSSEGAHTALKDTLDAERLFDLLWRAPWWKRVMIRLSRILSSTPWG